LKRAASILLLGTLLFNWCGYRLLTSYLEDSAHAALEAKLDDNNYNQSQLISIKVPVTRLGYYTNSVKFERVDGQIEIGGIQYKFVKRRLYNDSLELLCIPDHAAMNLQTAKNEFFKLVNDLQRSGGEKKGGSNSGSSKSFSIDYYTEDEILNLSHLQISGLPSPSSYSFYLPSCYSPIAEQPPDSAPAII
jgi:hypothetical protein